MKSTKALAKLWYNKLLPSIHPRHDVQRPPKPTPTKSSWQHLIWQKLAILKIVAYAGAGKTTT